MAEDKPDEPIDETLDCIGLYCPMPILKTREKIEEIAVGSMLEVLADDPASEPDLIAWARRTGQEIVRIDKTSEGLRFLIRRTK